MAHDKYSVTADFADGEHKFDLHGGDWDRLRELEDKRSAGCMLLFRRLYSGNYVVDDIREILRIGLMGGGMSATDALALVRRYIDRAPVNEHAGLALEVLGAALFGKGAEIPAEMAS